MGKKARTTLYIDSEILKEAQELGLNVSKTCEIALKQAIEQLRALYGKKESEDCPRCPQNWDVDGEGFEPSTSAMPTPRSFQTDLPARQNLMMNECY